MPSKKPAEPAKQKKAEINTGEGLVAAIPIDWRGVHVLCRDDEGRELSIIGVSLENRQGDQEIVLLVE